MSKLGIIIPTHLEWNILRLKIQNSKHDYRVSGMGKVNACIATTQLIIAGAESILLYGFAGGLRNLKRGETIEATDCIEGDYHAEELNEPYPNGITLRHTLNIFRRCQIVSQDHFLTLDEYRECNPPLANTLATDMEAYAVAKVCRELNVPFYAIKVISDIVGENTANDFFKPSDELVSTLTQSLEKTLSCLASQ